jgi:hypothetical protein
MKVKNLISCTLLVFSVTMSAQSIDSVKLENALEKIEVMQSWIKYDAETGEIKNYVCESYIEQLTRIKNLLLTSQRIPSRELMLLGKTTYDEK